MATLVSGRKQGKVIGTVISLVRQPLLTDSINHVSIYSSMHLNKDKTRLPQHVLSAQMVSHQTDCNFNQVLTTKYILKR